MDSQMYQKKIKKIQETAARKEKRLLKRIELAKGKPKPVSMKKLKKDLRTVTHAIVRLTYEICYSCGKFVPLKERQAGHFHTDGGNPGTRYDFDNLRTQHGRCNYILGGDAAFAARLLREIGEKWFLALDEKRKIKPNWSKQEYLNLIEERKLILQKLQNS